MDENEEAEKVRSAGGIWKLKLGAVYRILEVTAKVIATFTALVATLAFLCPWFGGWINLITARRFGVEGYAFYEVAPDPKQALAGDEAIIDYPFAMTKLGNFYAPHARSRVFEGIAPGDLLQAGSAAYLHEAPTKNSAVIYRFRDGECALVIGKDKAEPKQLEYSGGWLKVVTAACGLFK